MPFTLFGTALPVPQLLFRVGPFPLSLDGCLCRFLPVTLFIP
jgi:hypothetical protein